MNMIFIYRWLGSAGAVVGAVTGHIISKNTHAGYPVKLLVVAMLSGVLVSIGARIGQRLEQRRGEASYSV
jgi:membrane protein implicated in regulation of membrane protease activity